MVERLKQIMFSERGKSLGQIDAVYVPNLAALGDGTTIVLTVFPYPQDQQPTDRDMRDAFNAMTPESARKVADGSLTPQAKALLQSMTIKTSNLDLTNKRFTLAMQIKGPGGDVETHSYGFFGRHAMVQVNCSSSGANAGKFSSTYDQVAQSFSFDPAMAYSNSYASGRDAGKLLGQIGAFGIFALIVAAVVKKMRRA
jgi:hypothetical protein